MGYPLEVSQLWEGIREGLEGHSTLIWYIFVSKGFCGLGNLGSNRILVLEGASGIHHPLTMSCLSSICWVGYELFRSIYSVIKC